MTPLTVKLPNLWSLNAVTLSTEGGEYDATCPLLTCWAGAMGYTVYIDSHGDPQGNFTLLARRPARHDVGFTMHAVGSFLLDHNDTRLPVRSLRPRSHWKLFRS